MICTTSVLSNLDLPLRKALIVLNLIFLIPFTFSQEIQLSGTIEGGYNQEKLTGALIKERFSQQHVYSDEEGNFEMMLKPGYVRLNISLPSYQTQKHSFYLDKDTVLTLHLEPYTVDEVEILGRETYSEPELNKLTIQLPYYDRIPSLLGESDPMRTLTLFPGVQPALELSSGLVIRGGYLGQNLMLLDGIRLYNPYHLLGIVSTFNSYAIHSVDLYKGMFPARYGNRIASVMDLTTDSPKEQKRDRRISVGLLSSRIAWSDSLPKWNGDYLLAGRASYLSLFTLPAMLAYRSGNVDESLNYYLYDLNGKLNLELPKGGKLRFSGFLGQDFLHARSGNFEADEDVDKRYWGNTGLSVTHLKTWTQKWQLQSKLAFTRYQFLRKIVVWEDSIIQSTTTSEFLLSDLEAHTGIQRNFSQNIQLSAGISASQVSFIRETEFGKQRKDHRFLGNHWWEANIKWKNLTIQPGIRLVYFPSDDYYFTFAEPRLNVSLQVGKQTSVSASAGRVSQTFHLISETNLGLPNDIWIPASKEMPAQTGLQYALGVKWGDDDTPLQISLEGYYRQVDNMVLFRPDELYYELIPDENQIDQFITGGVGESYGLEAMVKYQTPRWQGWISYTLAKSTQQFPDFLGGRELPTPYDQRHNLQIVSNHNLNQKWLFSALWVFQSGRPIFLPVSRYIGADGRTVYVYPEKAGRYPFYNRVDLGFSHRKKLQNHRMRTWKFGVYNVFNRKNPLFLEINGPGTITSQGQTTYRPGKVIGFTVLPFTPYVSHEWRF